MKVFVDSDVVISSLISKKGAAYYLLNKTGLILYVSNHSVLELEKVGERLNIKKNKLALLLKRKFKVVKLSEDLDKIKEKFINYTSDADDSHIVVGAKKAKVRFLISYNIKDYKQEKISKDFNIIVITPAKLLQYLRSIS